jgi:diketogulonate reductase-like aldo/keto reductase
MQKVKTVPLNVAGASMPALGLGTWRLGESKRSRAAEVAAVRTAFELGYRLVDTAEMYGEGGAEEVVGQALAEAIAAGEVRREHVFVVTKVYPHNASARGVAAACDRSRSRLRLDTVDLYLLHWRGSHPLAATVEGFERLRDAGHIRHWGAEFRHRRHAGTVATGVRAEVCRELVYYSASRRGIEFDLLPWQRGIVAAMA